MGGEITRDKPVLAKSVKTVETLQFLRFLAAGLVVLAHISFYVHNRVDDQFSILGHLAQGVALFFVISGFIMTVTTNPQMGRKGAVRYFAISRVIRIVPLYWAVNIAKLAGVILVPSMIAANPTVANVVLSFLFLPAKNADGVVEAFYGVGWSLNFEMAFYALFAVALLLKIRPAFLVIPLLLVAAAFSQVKHAGWPAAAYLLSPVLLNFVWGILIAEWYLANRSLTPIISVSLIGLGFFAMFSDWIAMEFLTQSGLCFGAIVLGFVSLESTIRGRIPRVFSYFGDASYSLYLTHPMFGVFAVVVIDKLSPGMNPWLLFTICTALSFAFASVVHTYFEMPITRWLRLRLLSQRPEVDAMPKAPLRSRW